MHTYISSVHIVTLEESEEVYTPEIILLGYLSDALFQIKKEIEKIMEQIEKMNDNISEGSTGTDMPKRFKGIQR